MPLRLVIADDSYIVREGLNRLLERDPDLEVVAECHAFDPLLAAVDEHLPDVVVTDIRMPPTSTDEGVRAARILRETHPKVGVVVLSQYLEPEYAISLLAAGAGGRAYLLKERVNQGEQLRSAIQEVHRGGSVIDPAVIDSLVAAKEAARWSPLSEVTGREREVLAAMASGNSNAGIAKTLTLSERAVEKHINSVFSKLGLIGERDVNRRVKAVLVFLAENGA